VITEYPWPEAIALMTVFTLFFAELMTMRYGNFGHDHADEHAHSAHEAEELPKLGSDSPDKDEEGPNNYREDEVTAIAGYPRRHTHARGEDHLGHSREHRDNDDLESDWEQRETTPESYAAQMTAIFILEFGVIFHSIFIGLTLAVAGSEFTTLYIVLVFHQTFEGLGLGTRLSGAPWPKSKRWTPYVFGVAYAVSTPIAIAVGLGVRTTYPPGSRTTLITNGVFDSISAGILLYTGLVELMAHEFMFSPTMQNAKISTLLSAFVLMCLGAGLMALLGKWA
jgi:zinc transporter 1/2/3